MRALLSIISFVAVMALAFWAYRENYATQTQLKEMAKVQDQIAALRDEIAMQKAEWAYLNRPTRLRDLAAMNFDRLGLMPMTALQLGSAADVAMPVAEPLLITGEVQADGTLSPALQSTEEAQIP
jgi:hypothetical protein